MKYRIECACLRTGRDMAVELDARDFRDAEAALQDRGLLIGAVREAGSSAPEATATERRHVPGCKQMAILAVLAAIASLATPVAAAPTLAGIVMVYGFQSTLSWSVVALVLLSAWLLGVASPTSLPRSSGLAPSFVVALLATAGSIALLFYLREDGGDGHIGVSIYIGIGSAVIAMIASLIAFVTPSRKSGSRAAYA